MNINQDKILVIAGSELRRTIKNSIEDIPNLGILHTDSENKAFELIYTHPLVLVIIDETLSFLNKYTIGSMMLSHIKTHNAPLLVITDNYKPSHFLTDFKALHIDYILKPIDTQFMRSKINIFYTLFKQQNGILQSMDELENAYQKIMEQHELVMKEDFSKKEIINRSRITANQIQQPLSSIQANTYQLQRRQQKATSIKPGLSAIKTSAERISQISKRLHSFSGESKMFQGKSTLSIEPGQVYQVLYVADSSESFHILHHVLKGVIKCELILAKSLEQALKAIADNRFDLIFTDYLLVDSTGFDLLKRLHRIKSDTPVIFSLGRSHIHKGVEVVVKGAYNYFVKEEISAGKIHSLIYNTFQRVKITREIQDARDRITLISRKDLLTRLCNRPAFETALEAEISRANRYHTPLSVLFFGFDDFENINQTHGYETGDSLLTTGAALIQSMVRNNDLVGRYGGEVFAILLYHTASPGAGVLSNRLREKIDGFEFKKDSMVLQLTASIGFAVYDPERDMTYSDLLKRSEKALLSARAKGGNKVAAFKGETA